MENVQLREKLKDQEEAFDEEKRQCLWMPLAKKDVS